MSSAIHSDRADVTAKQAAIGGGMDMRVLFMCGHKGANAGAQFRRYLPWRCAACVAQKDPQR